jgi:hypothetical protein
MIDLNKKVLENINKKCLNRVTIDIDHVRALPMPLLKAVVKFGYDNVKLYKTPSGTGFRIVIFGEFTPLENILIRSILEDDPYRIRFALHRYLISGQVDVLDVAFWYKYNKNVGYDGFIQELPLKEIVTEKAIENYLNGNISEAYNEVFSNANRFIDKLYLYAIVIPAKKEYLDKLQEILKKYKVLADPYHDDRVIVYVVSSENIVELFNKNNIEIIHYRVKEVKSKNIEIF